MITSGILLCLNKLHLKTYNAIRKMRTFFSIKVKLFSGNYGPLGVGICKKKNRQFVCLSVWLCQIRPPSTLNSVVCVHQSYRLIHTIWTLKNYHISLNSSKNGVISWHFYMSGVLKDLLCKVCSVYFFFSDQPKKIFCKFFGHLRVRICNKIFLNSVNVSKILSPA